MPLKEGSTNVIRLYKRTTTTSLEKVYSPITFTGICGPTLPDDPNNTSCTTIGQRVSYDGQCYECMYKEISTYVDDEIMELKNTDEEMIHRRTSITFNPNGGTGGGTQIRTWNVENVLNPGNPIRSGQIFKGWFTASSGGQLVSPPFLAPQNNVTYYAQWQSMAGTQTTTPTINHMISTPPGPFPIQAHMIQVKNNDVETATILMDTSNPPSTSRGNIGSNSTTTWYSMGQASFPLTVYATAQASGRTKSSVVSKSVG